jgi:NAD(P)-dependent dehydrogenase (short-subunit alcohol dehydrogenase family)
VTSAQASIDAFGGICTLVHNAGSGGPADLATGTLEQWNKAVSVNQSSFFLGCKYAETAVADSAKRGEAASCIIIASVLNASGTWGDKPGLPW